MHRITRLPVGTHECRASDVSVIARVVYGASDELVADLYDMLRAFGSVPTQYHTFTRTPDQEYSVTVHEQPPLTAADRPRRQAAGRELGIRNR